MHCHAPVGADQQPHSPASRRAGTGQAVLKHRHAGSDSMQPRSTHCIELSEGRRVQVGGGQHLCQLCLLLLQYITHCTAARGGALVKTRQGGQVLTRRRVKSRRGGIQQFLPNHLVQQAVTVQSMSSMAHWLSQWQSLRSRSCIRIWHHASCIMHGCCRKDYTERCPSQSEATGMLCRLMCFSSRCLVTLKPHQHAIRPGTTSSIM